MKNIKKPLSHIKLSHIISMFILLSPFFALKISSDEQSEFLRLLDFNSF